MRVCVEGNIGSGKSTALGLLPDLLPGVPIFREPVEEWGDLFRRYYEDPVAWALPFSLKVLLGHQAALKATDPLVVVERSPMSGRHVFGQLLFNDGKLSREEWDLFKEYCDVLGWTPDAVVYLHTPPDECSRRIEARGRPEERGVDLHYLKRLEFQHEVMLRYGDLPVVRLDGTKPPEELARDMAEAITRCRAAAS